MGASENYPVEPSGLWREIRRQIASHQMRPALFVDRDGTLIELVEYLADPECVRLVPGAADTLRHANQADIPVLVVTNQSGIERGYYDWKAFSAVQDRMHELLAVQNARVDAVYACPALPESGDANRKPNPGMLLAAAEDFALDLPQSWIVGDSARDLEAARRAGLGHGWLVPTGYGERDIDAAKALAQAGFQVTVAREIAAIVSEMVDAAHVRSHMGE